MGRFDTINANFIDVKLKNTLSFSAPVCYNITIKLIKE